MSRIIKFRLWDKNHKKWAKVRNRILDRNGAEKYYYFTADDIERFVFQQFTGLYDKNNIEIYEGDILKLSKAGAENIVGTVWYKQESAKFVVSERNLTFSDFYKLGFETEIIGNIFEPFNY